ncbi:MAG: NAD(P)-dependent oxidoreductase, partial [Pseudomonadota bacterium]
SKYTIGWVGMGRMGYPMAERLAKAGADLAVWNRTRSKAEPLTEYGATIVDNLSDLGSRDIVFSMVSTSNDVKQVLFGENGILSGDSVPKIFVECSSISVEASAEIRAELEARGAKYIASPVSGNGKCVKAGKLALVTSGPRDVYDEVRIYQEIIAGLGVTYVGEGELSRTMKICHNVFLGVVTQSLAELTILAQKAGVPRHAFLEFINKSVMGSIFTKYKTPGWVKQDYTTTFTPELMRKDMDLGLGLGREHEVPMPVAGATRDIIQQSMGHGNAGDVDFSIVLEYMAQCAGIEKLESEDVEVADGLEAA